MTPTEAATTIVHQIDLLQRQYDMPYSEVSVVYQALSDIMTFVIDHQMNNLA